MLVSFDAMKRAAETAAQIAAGATPVAPVEVTIRKTPDRYPVEVESIDVEGAAKKAILERADRAARAADSSFPLITCTSAKCFVLLA